MPTFAAVGMGSATAKMWGFTKFTHAQLHVVTSQFVMFIPCALRGSKVELDPDMLIEPEEVQYVPREVNFHLQLAIVLRVIVTL